MKKVEGICLQVLQAALDKAGQVLTVIAAGDVRVEPPPGLGRNDELLIAGFAHLGNQLLRVSIAIDISRVEEVDSEVQRPMNRCDR